MKTLLIESDTYLAQSISNKLIDHGYECVVQKNIDFEIDKDSFFDVVLISYDVCTTHCINFIKKFPNSIIIMMIKYINDSTVTKMLKNGMHDYILKPFVVDELMRKVEHYKQFARLQREVMFYKDYFEFIEGILNTPLPHTFNLPFIVRSNNQRSADIYAMRYARLKNIQFNFLSLNNINWRDVLTLGNSIKEAIYLTGLERLKKNERNELLSKLSKQNILISFFSKEEITFNNIVDISTQQVNIDFNSEILSIKDYEKTTIMKYEHVYSDIELAKKLGISRKSLWEKRKRYGIAKKRQKNYIENKL